MAKKSTGLNIVFIALILLALGGGYYMYMQGEQGASFMGDMPPQPEAITGQAGDTPALPGAEAEKPEEIRTAETEETRPETAAQPEETEPAEASPPSDLPADSELAGLLRPRILGNPDAPVKIIEYSSLTCGHCGSFHKNTFKQLRENYIDTGKAYLVFSDFPLNAAALHASMTARCLPEERYFNFVQMLFETQDQWAHKPDYLESLKQSAMLAGLGEEEFKQCVQNEALQKGLLKTMQDAQQKWQVSSTPTFVINDKVTVSGSYPYEHFQNVLNKELENLAN